MSAPARLEGMIGAGDLEELGEAFRGIANATKEAIAAYQDFNQALSPPRVISFNLSTWNHPFPPPQFAVWHPPIWMFK